jgi:sulfoxide reductase heme-binding subunit YedZ
MAAKSWRVPAINTWYLYAAGLIPAALYFYWGATGNLGINPVKTFEHALGLWALKFLIATLAVSPIRELTGLSFLRYRRALGLLAFYYVVMHVAVYVLLDQQMNFATIVADIIKRPYITLGMAALVMLIPLALTSSNAAIKRLGAKWTKLHRLTYPVAIAACLHYFLLVKSITLEPFIHIALIALLLFWRVIRKPYLNWRKSPKT